MRAGWAKSVAAVAGALAAFLPVGRCPACYAAATGLAGSLGLGWIATSPWLMWVLGGFLGIGLWGLVSSARVHRRWGAVGVGAAGAALLIGARVAGEAPIAWVGAGLLTLGFVLDFYWKRSASAAQIVPISGIE